MLPARQRADATGLRVRDAVQALDRGVAEDCALHVRRLDLGARYQDLAVGVDYGLGYVEGVVPVLGESQHDDDFVLGGAVLDLSHLWRVDFKGVAYV